jgi:NAD(P)-dependent dehydrogenase (short-subunit alcohol dehydrogenase family)
LIFFIKLAMDVLPLDQLTNWPAIRAFVPTVHEDTYPFISPDNADLSGKSVLITGASKGLGKAQALSFAKAGCSRIAVVSRTGLDELKTELMAAAKTAGKPEPLVLTIPLDITSEAGVAAATGVVSEAFNGVLDILVTNAGRVSDAVPLTETRVDDWWATWEVNIKGTYCKWHIITVPRCLPVSASEMGGPSRVFKGSIEAMNVPRIRH